MDLDLLSDAPKFQKNTAEYLRTFSKVSQSAIHPLNSFSRTLPEPVVCVMQVMLICSMAYVAGTAVVLSSPASLAFAKTALTQAHQAVASIQLPSDWILIIPPRHLRFSMDQYHEPWMMAIAPADTNETEELMDVFQQEAETEPEVAESVPVTMPPGEKQSRGSSPLGAFCVGSLLTLSLLKSCVASCPKSSMLPSDPLGQNNLLESSPVFNDLDPAMQNLPEGRPKDLSYCRWKNCQVGRPSECQMNSAVDTIALDRLSGPGDFMSVSPVDERLSAGSSEFFPGKIEPSRNLDQFDDWLSDRPVMISDNPFVDQWKCCSREYYGDRWLPFHVESVNHLVLC